MPYNNYFEKIIFEWRVFIISTVKIDIYAKDRKYYNTKFSTKEDIENLFFTLDIIKNDAYTNDNYEALVTYLDFLKILDDDAVISEYYKILMNDKVYISKEDKKADIKRIKLNQDIDILDLVSRNLNIPKDECINRLDKSLIKMVQVNDDLEVIKINPLSKSLQDVDYNRKYVVPNLSYQEKDYPQDLQDFINEQKRNQVKIDKLNKLKKDKKLTKKQKIERGKRIKHNVKLWEDIHDLKEHYRIPIKNNMVKEKTEIVSFNGDYMIEGKMTEDLKSNAFSDQWQLHKIKRTAEEVLTCKQLYIFKLRFIAGLKQEEIADMLNETQGHISRDINICLEKIKNNLEKK